MVNAFSKGTGNSDKESIAPYSHLLPHPVVVAVLRAKKENA
ncbi:hypothetical protein [Cyanobacterium aponinum]|nr:hypothetical protein [Cyanobacterium aponinum]